MGQLPLAESRLCALFVECILYGFYIITFAYTAQALLFSGYMLKGFREVNKPVAFGTTSLFFMITGNMILNFHRSLRAFVFSQAPGGAEAEYNNVSGWLNIVETAFILFGTLVGDWILLHRCWILWNRTWKWISISSILWIGCFFCTIRIIILEASFKDRGVFNSDAILPYGSSFWAASILINISTTVLTVYRIWLVMEANKQSGLQPLEVDEFPKSTLHFVICITVESGLLNTISAVATFVTYVIASNSVYIMTAIELPVAGMACNLIILRANRRTKRLLKFKMKQAHADYLSEFLAGVPDTIPLSTTTISERGGLPTTNTGTSSSLPVIPEVQSHSRGRIEELPYP
ncbi:hypothetical protein D9756_010819 [Leucocoprinus leucothites]|uniref:Uncharacterized protein n=1 Tax=Leucocoprinus leucothites TaxID=201217 RepID=A0A8H5FQQ1_9AGAR|nr:hypothetical protein D9756_010819 [Leucoagaricus leucothites]